MGKSGPGQPTACEVAHDTVAAQLLEDRCRSLSGWTKHRHMRGVLRRGPDHRRATDVHRLDRGVSLERVEVAHDKVDRLMSWAARSSRWERMDRSARIPAWTAGCRVFTRPSSISGTPVISATSVCSIPAASRTLAVPPLATSSTPRPQGRLRTPPGRSCRIQTESARTNERRYQGLARAAPGAKGTALAPTRRVVRSPGLGGVMFESPRRGSGDARAPS